MHPFIRQFPSKAFYSNKLRDALRITSEVEKHDLCMTESLSLPSSLQSAMENASNDGIVCSAMPPKNDGVISRSSNIKRNVTCDIVRPNHPQYLNPVMFFDLRSNEMSANKSFRNVKESAYILSLLECYAPCFVDMSIAIISPYKSQVHFFKNEMQSKPLFAKRNRHGSSRGVGGGSASGNGSTETQLSLDVEVDTVDGFQGREKDIVFLSTVRTSHVGFLADNRRLNVAITRAKKCLIIVGHEPTLSKDKLWGDMIKDLKDRKCIFTAPVSGKFSDYSGYADLKDGIAAVMNGLKPTPVSALTVVNQSMGVSVGNEKSSSGKKKGSEKRNKVRGEVIRDEVIRDEVRSEVNADLEEGEVEEEESGTARANSGGSGNGGCKGARAGLDSALSSKRSAAISSDCRQDDIVIKRRRI
jgi:hypothetical protein